MKKKLRNLISKGKTKQTIELLLKVTEGLDIHDQVIMQSARFEDYQNAKTLGTSSPENEGIAISNINKSLLVLINEINENELSDDITMRIYVKDFAQYIEEKTRLFIGREWLFDKINAFIEKYSNGYIFISGDPGIGKSAIAAKLVSENGYIHHFNIRAQGINKTEAFLLNICAQLIIKYKLNIQSLPKDAKTDSNFLTSLLRNISEELKKKKEKCVIIVDALDEVDTNDLDFGVNPLYLPLSLPDNIYFIITLRPDEKYFPRIDTHWENIEISNESNENLSDISLYLDTFSQKIGIKNYINNQNITSEKFKEILLGKSEGNFMYLYHVIPEIELGYYQTLELNKLPKGLMNFYKSHWILMKGQNEEAWFSYKLPVIMALTVVKEPISINLIVDFSGVSSINRIRGVINDWQSFLHEEEVFIDNRITKQYRIYHSSFQEFISDLEEVKDEKVSMTDIHKKIANNLFNKLYEDE